MAGYPNYFKERKRGERDIERESGIVSVYQRWGVLPRENHFSTIKSLRKL